MPVTTDQLHALTTGLKENFNKGLKNATPQHNKIATVIKSNNRSEDYAQLGNWPKIREWIGDRQLAKLKKHVYTITNKKYESSIVVDRDDVDDDVLGLYGAQAESIGDDASLFPDELVFGLLMQGFTEICYDGLPFFSANHLVGEEGKETPVTNIVGTGDEGGEPWFLLDTSRPLKPLIHQKRRDFEFKAMDDMNSDHVVLKDEFIYVVDGRGNAGFGFWQLAIGSTAPLTKENINKARKLMRSFTSDNGTPLLVKPTTLVVGGDNEAVAEELILTEKTGNTSNTLYKKFDLLVSPHIVVPEKIEATTAKAETTK